MVIKNEELLSFHEKFFQMEKEFNLFSIRTKHEFPLWDIVRYRVAYELLNPKSITQKQKTSLRKKFLTVLKIFKHLPKVFLPFNENLFFLSARNFDEIEMQFDKNAHNAINSLDKNHITIIESYNPEGNYKYQDYNFILNIAIVFLTKLTKKTQINKNDFNKIENAINLTFGANSIKQELFYSEFQDFYRTYRIFDNIFRRNKNRIKKLFITQNGILKGIFFAASKNHIKTFEFQHGIIDKTHFAYSYSPEIRYKINDIICSDNLFTFSKYWNTQFHNPYQKFIPIGNDSFFNKHIHSGEHYLTVVSSMIHEEYLASFTKELALKMTGLQIFYKLHPNQFANSENIKLFFKGYKNINIITNEMSVPLLISKSFAILTIVSTAVYEALHNGINVIILKRSNFLAHESLFKNPNIFLIDKLGDFETIINDKANNSQIQDDVFFKPFNKELFMEILEDNSVN